MSTTKRREPPRRLYAFTDSIEGPTPDNPNRRTSIVFETVDADLFDRLGAGFWDEASTLERQKGLGVLRVLTTERRFDEIWGRVPEETGWLEVEIGHAPGYPRASYFDDTEPLEAGHRLNLFRVRHLDLEQAVQESLETASIASQVVKISSEEVLHRIIQNWPDLTVTAVDVGQAACVAFASGNETIGYFDVGAPAPFHRATFPSHFRHNFASNGFVLLSHWDMDHYQLATRYPQLKNLNWYAPFQKVSIRCADFQRSLGSRLHFISGAASFRGIRLVQATGTNPKDRNATGYVMRFERGAESVLLTGDADYNYIPAPLLSGLTAIATPHHAGKVIGLVPKAGALAVPARAVASYGNPNRYHHPHAPHLARLHANGWWVRHTARNSIWPRSDQRLYPLLTRPRAGNQRSVSNPALAESVQAV